MSLFACTAFVAGLIVVAGSFLLGGQLEMEGRLVREKQDTSSLLRGCAWICTMCFLTGALLLARHMSVAAVGSLQQMTAPKAVSESNN